MMYVKGNKRVNVAPPSDAFRASIKSIVDEDANALAEAVASTQLSQEMALTVAAQAWRNDVGNGKVGDFAHEGGLLSAVYIGTVHAQKATGVDMGYADNATTLVASLACKEDDPRILDVLIEWDPSFRMGPPDSKATVDSTARFFLDYDAPKCAARMLERKEELIMAPRNGFLDSHAEERVVLIAKGLLEKGASNRVVAAALNQLVEDQGKISVFDIECGGGQMSVFSIGLSLLGRPEILAICAAGQVKKVSKKIRKLARQSQRGDMVNLPDMKNFVKMSENHLLVNLIDAVTHLRDPKTPAIVFYQH